MSPLAITDSIVIPADDLAMRAVRSSGPGGQNVNKVATKVELRFDLAGSRAVSEVLKARLRLLFPNRIDRAGGVFVVSQRTRDQHVNLSDARDKLRELVRAALITTRPRVATKPSVRVKRRRVEQKRREGAKKAARRTFEGS